MTIGLFRSDVGDAPRRSLLGTALRRVSSFVRAVPHDADAQRLRRLDQVCVVLADARQSLIEDGWVQNTWYARRADPGTTTAACLVGAVVRAARRHEPGAGPLAAGPTLDVLWDALQESRGMGGPGLAGRAVPPQVRTARVRDLTRWNDRAGRSRAEVLELIDLATSRAIMEAMHTSRPEVVGTPR